MKRCYIFAAAKGLPCNFGKTDGDFIIAADGGLNHARNIGLEPDVILGDFDSLNNVPEGSNVKIYPTKKDDTDTMLGIKLGLEKGYKEFYIYGGTGGRLDHTLANLQALSYISEQGGCGFLCGEGYTAAVIKNNSISFKSEAKGYISVFSFSGNAKGVSLENLLFCGDDLSLEDTFPLGVSNEFTGESAKIRVKKGTLLIIWQGTPDLAYDFLF